MNLILITILCFFILKYYFNFEIINKAYIYLKYIVIVILIYLVIKYHNHPQLKQSIIQSIRKIEQVPVERGIVELENCWNSLQDLNDTINKNNTNQMNTIHQTMNTNQMNTEQNSRHKRNVTNGQKKYVAAYQQWKCGHCKQLLDASYEVDHIIALYKGGTNHLDNLVALCRNCHGNKTMKERLHLL